ncbi:orotate phosphoribosyltransferase [Jeotgalibacillus haloalkalitolerans]|uniref:Orotate phosphoribosyltransferase n=1 Tax=Jeotgalibacillus haloalkalitolerans TaxID=3104292 RepID=A0ABU5KK99_9BACL|nr:orotate phosphoribosyltransferase [Jeotgalibacillus sp. HH7-29]MDZ5711595.1 orotate phosphoribosyltransferase [Jeotgalibacillus sp. HH7-29]
MNKKMAAYLLEIKAVELNPENPFTWASGIKSPIYCDNRLIMSYPEIRSYAADQLTELIKTNFAEAEIIAGTATAGIPHAAWVSERLNLPMNYVRSSAKKHGKTNQIEGKVTPGKKAVVIEDLISTGGSSIDAVKALEEQGIKVLGVAALFTYGFKKAEQQFKEAGVPYYTVTNFDTLIEQASVLNYISQDQVNELAKWKSEF